MNFNNPSQNFLVFFSQSPVNRDMPNKTNLQFWYIFPKFVELIISGVFCSPTDFPNHEIRSNVPGLVPNIWELAVRRLLSALGEEAFLLKRSYCDTIKWTKGQQCFIFVAACMKCVLHFLTSFCVTLCLAMRPFYMIVYFQHHRVTFVP